MMHSNVILYYFSGTGNTRRVARAASTRLKEVGYGCRLVEITTDTVPELNYIGSTLGIAFPVYGLSVPGIVRRFLLSLPKTVNGSSFIIANAHTTSGSSLREAEKLLRRSGYNVEGTTLTLTPSSSIITEETEPKDTAEMMLADAAVTCRQFIDDLVSGRGEKLIETVTLRQQIVRSLFRSVMPGPVLKAAHATDACTGCGTCARRCPVHNIRLENNKPVWGKSCETCMRCINLCPSEAIEMMHSSGKRRYVEGWLE